MSSEPTSCPMLDRVLTDHRWVEALDRISGGHGVEIMRCADMLARHKALSASFGIQSVSPSELPGLLRPYPPPCLVNGPTVAIDVAAFNRPLIDLQRRNVP